MDKPNINIKREITAALNNLINTCLKLHQSL